MVPEMDQLKARLDDAKRALDKEQLKSSGLENKCASLEEDLKFQLSLLEKELTEVKQRKEIEITEMDGKLQARNILLRRKPTRHFDPLLFRIIYVAWHLDSCVLGQVLLPKWTFLPFNISLFP